jgi:hypothetical protein
MGRFYRDDELALQGVYRQGATLRAVRPCEAKTTGTLHTHHQLPPRAPRRFEIRTELLAAALAVGVAALLVAWLLDGPR